MAPKVELNIGGTWTDVTDPDVRKGDSGLSITRGRGDYQSQVPYGRLTARLASPTGKYSNRNPLSPYFGQLKRNIPIRVGADPMADTFTRTVVDGWGTSSSGHAWTIAAGTASNFDVNGSVGTVVPTASRHVAVLPNRYGEVDVLCKMRFGALTGGPLFGIVTNWQSITNHYGFIVDSSLNQAFILKVVGGTSVNVAVVAFTPSAGVDYWIRASSGKRLRMKVWQDGSPEPDTWTRDIWPVLPSTPTLLPAAKVGLIAQFGTSVTVSFDSLTVDSYRFHGEVSAWPPRKADNGDDVTVPIQASGILRRLTRSAPAVQSPMRREATKPSVQQYTVALWPCEDGTTATTLASTVPGVTPLKFTGPVSPGQDTSIPGAKALPVFGTLGGFDGVVPKTPSTTGKVFYRIILDVPDSPSTADDTNVLNVYCTGGNIVAIRIYYRTGSSGSFDVRAMTSTGTVIDSTVLAAAGINGKRFYFSVEAVQNGANADTVCGSNFISDDNQSVTSFVQSKSWAGVTVGRAYRVNAGSMDGWGFGFVGVGNNQAFMFSMATALVGNSGELAGNRAIRIAAEAGIALQVVGDPADTPPMGPQVDGSSLDVLRSCEAVDSGVLYESRNELGLTLRTRVSMQNQTGPSLDYAGGQVTTLDPTEDDQGLANDVIASRINGSSARATLDEGPLSTQDPPNGVGRYEGGPPSALNFRTDDQLPDRAGWELLQGTWDEQRLQAVGTKMYTPEVQADPDLRAQLAALDTGDVFTVTSPPAWLGPDPTGQMVQGYTETLGDGGPDLWSIDWNTTPAGPWTVAEADGDPRVDTDGSALAAAATSGATSLLVAPTDPDFDLWVSGTTVTNTTDFPVDITVGGERMTVTAIADGVADTFTRSVSNGWGTATSGQAWTVTATASDYSATGTVGRIATTTINSLYLATVDCGSTDQAVFVSETLPVVPTGAGFTLRCVARFTDASNFYNATVTVAVGGAATVQLTKNVAGVGSIIASAVSVGTHAAGNQWMVVLQVIGSTVRAKAWNASQSGPVPVWQVTATDTDLTGGTRAGCGVRRETGNTDGTQNVDFDGFGLSVPQLFTVTRSVNGIVKAQTAGTAVNVFEPAYAPL
ncbi:MAG TPA: hypothetical protein VIP77_16155 [Jiangellaceae bacterium]